VRLNWCRPRSTLVRAQLLKVSGATIDGLLKPTRDAGRPKGLSATRAGPLLRNSITVRKAGDEHEQAPGFIEADMVVHCGLRRSRQGPRCAGRCPRRAAQFPGEGLEGVRRGFDDRFASGGGMTPHRKRQSWPGRPCGSGRARFLALLRAGCGLCLLMSRRCAGRPVVSWA
jgi:hypothetical protein